MQALHKLLAIFGPNDLRVAQAYINAASNYAAQNNLTRARTYNENALKVSNARLQVSHIVLGYIPAL